MKFRELAALAASLSFFSATAALAQQLDETVVTATRSRAAIADVNVPVIVISRSDIERSLATDVGELLTEHAGLEVARNGGPGQTASVFVRGSNSNHTVVMIDGVRINPGTIGGAAIQNIAPETIERIEIVKGPRSTLYGTDAIGGVINIFTRAGTHQGLSASASGGRYGTNSVHADGGTALGERGNVGFSVGRNVSAGFPTLEGSSDDRGYRNNTLNLYGEFAANDTIKLRARAWRAAGNTEYSDFFVTPIDQDFVNAAYSAELDWQRGASTHGRLSLSRAEDEVIQNQGDDFVSTRRYSLDAQMDWMLGVHQLTAGTLLTRENARALSFGLPFDVDTAVNLLYLQDQLGWGPHKLLLAAGYTDHQTFGNQLTWNAEYGRSFQHGTRISVAAGTAFHAPGATDRYGFGGNPNLRPEVSRQLELSLHQTLGMQQEVWTSIFSNSVDDLINFHVTDPLTFDGRNENIERARVRGVEVGYQLHGEHWRLRAEAAFNDPRNRITGERLLRRAQNTWVLAAEHHSGRLELGADILRSGTRQDFGFPNAVALAPYTLLNVSARFSVNKQWSLQARLDNVTDQRYQLASGYNSPRRSLLLAARWHFR